jgi:endo-1,4-beta-xylanase
MENPMKLFKALLPITLIALMACSQSNSPLESSLNSAAPEMQNESLAKSKNYPVHSTTQTITIDGNKKDWSGAAKRNLNQYFDLPDAKDNALDLSSYFQMLWDDNNLYVYVRVVDQVISTNAENPWEMDSIELYLDTNNSKNTGDTSSWPPAAYGDTCDQLRYIAGQPGPVGYGILDLSNYESQQAVTSTGWSLEVRIPLADLPEFAAERGHAFGFEVHINDNDSDYRQNILKWNSSVDDSYYNPASFGTAVLF